MSEPTDIEFERALLRADIRAGNTEAAQEQYQRVVKIENDQTDDEDTEPTA